MKRTTKTWILRLVILVAFSFGSTAINMAIDGNSSSWLIGWCAACFALSGMSLIDIFE